MKKFVVFIVLVIFLMVKVKTVVGNGQAITYFEKRPSQRGSATMLYALANYYEIFSDFRQAERSFKIVVDNYPKYRYAMESMYGWAYAIEKQKDRARAIAAYQEFLKVYPESKRSETVRNNIYILGS